MDESEAIAKATRNLADYGALGICLSAAIGLIWYLVRLVKLSFVRLAGLADRMMEWLNSHNDKMDENTRAQNRLSKLIEDVIRKKKNGN